MEQYLSQLQTFANENLMPYAWNIVAALVIFIVGKWIVGRLAGWVNRMMDKRVDATVAKFIGNIVHIILFVFVVIASLDQLGVETTSLVAIVGAAGLAVGLALKDSLGNFAAGVMLILFKPFRVGHYVEAGGTAGTVKEIKIFATIMMSPDNKVITVPNGSIMSGNITNYSEMPTRRVDMVFGVAYDADLSLVKKTLEEILAADDRVLKDPAPVIAVGELADSSVNFLCRPWVKSADFWGVKWDTTETVKRRFDEAGIGIPFPQMDVHLDKSE
ncbi:MAG: mechanosensitive ion channel protein MscS [Alcanivoracaceae bacterium]|mgnify:CR=1 FL=1|uniref:Small-conductance mechanosensitive channel n=1 Tax=Alcanivorax profundi TaxID=2338368 RepID=A0A418Y363_9GAMM|nr:MULTISPECIES: mechanosensitive ion channel domain-containing protein [Alcanivorax]MAX55352.1 mechanosensitive ion channel protein MscS [Alcanivoracaceae bacterium]MCG8439155.1 mechanosensitive ion channel [Pseudomonadales bacterium]MEE2870266.1 mechanosensitive ion channel domain-containing protein [Pseudomonadota bacterium]ERP92812.1 mechanosensitive ion channel protein [Alcanivorax sp. P2S70]PNE02086.1 small-conductance mechanosensitive channel [Alcanivorax sp. MD8A]|tara:strand:- start:4109 stop:4927 length:819 start_codon:yes stop_codon:yes gene_type:complete